MTDPTPLTDQQLDTIQASAAAATPGPLGVYETTARTAIADVLSAADGWRWGHRFDRTSSPAYQRYLTLADTVLAALPDPATARAAVLREAADHLTRQADELWAPGRTAHTVMHADAAELRRMAGGEQPGTETQAANPNVGPGWYEVINPRNATTCIALVYDDGSLYLPEGDDLTHEEFAFAAARGNAHRLVRADEQPAAVARQDGEADRG